MRINLLEFNPQALTEADAAIRWYRERSERAAADFILEIDRAIAKILKAPHRWPEFDPGYRRLLLTRFPYWIIYREKTAYSIEVMAIAHIRRRPGYWRYRI